MSGYQDGTYCPDVLMNRAELLRVTVDAVSAPGDADACLAGFRNAYGPDALFLADIVPGTWYEKYYCLAVVRRLVPADSRQVYDPQALVTVGEAAKILAAGFRLPVAPDAAAAPSKSSLAALAAKQALPPDTGGPEDGVSRGLLSQMLYSLLQPDPARASLSADDVIFRGASLSPFARSVLRAVNAERSKVGLPPFRYNVLLERAASGHAADMQQRRYISHETPEGLTIQNRINAAGYPSVDKATCDCRGWSYVFGEVLDQGDATIEDVMTAFMHSPVHRGILLSPDFDEIGAGISGLSWAFDVGRTVLKR